VREALARYFYSTAYRQLFKKHVLFNYNLTVLMALAGSLVPISFILLDQFKTPTLNRVCCTYSFIHTFIEQVQLYIVLYLRTSLFFELIYVLVSLLKTFA
jgi:hypothetical protein